MCFCVLENVFVAPRPSSTTTRIKTAFSVCKCFFKWTPRPSSTTTRIKTLPCFTQVLEFVGLRDHLPLQQGLRLNITFLWYVLRRLRDHLPLQQGLRHLFMFPMDCLFQTLRDHLPLQQGLRLLLWWTTLMLQGFSETIFHYNKD